MGWFSPKPPVDLDEFEWLVACFAWLHENLGNPAAANGHIPQLARHDTPGIAESKGAGELFEAIRELAGMSDWECALQQGEPARSLEGIVPIGEFSSKSALGTFSIEGNTPIIRYDPRLLRNPEQLTATLAHELAHLLICSLGDPPGGHDLHEHATDCAAVYIGFGVFMANSARHFEQFQDLGMQGWRSSNSGYLSENALVTALALFVRLFGHEAGHARDPLKSYLRKDFDKAIKYLDSQATDVGELIAQVDLSEWS